MNKIVPFIFLIVPVLIAFWLCDWQIVVAFVIAVLIVPILLISLFHVYEIYYQQTEIKWNDVFAISALYSVIGLPLYLLCVLPIFYGLKILPYPLHYSFPFSLAIIMLTLFILITTQPWDYKEVLIILACSLIHSYFILWLIARLKGLTISA